MQAMSVTLDQARAAKAKLVEELGSKAGIVGIGIGKDHASYCVKVSLQKENRRGLPRAVDGVTIRYEVVGTVRAR